MNLNLSAFHVPNTTNPTKPWALNLERLNPQTLSRGFSGLRECMSMLQESLDPADQ